MDDIEQVNLTELTKAMGRQYQVLLDWLHLLNWLHKLMDSVMCFEDYDARGSELARHQDVVYKRLKSLEKAALNKRYRTIFYTDWLEEGMGRFPRGLSIWRFVCSECGEITLKPTYCPKCGYDTRIEHDRSLAPTRTCVNGVPLGRTGSFDAWVFEFATNPSTEDQDEKTDATRPIAFWSCGEGEQRTLTQTDRNEAIEAYLDGLDERPLLLKIYGWSVVECDPNWLGGVAVKALLDTLDEEYGDPNGKATESDYLMMKDEEALIKTVVSRYSVWRCEKVYEGLIETDRWVKGYRPDWLAGGDWPLSTPTRG